MLAAKMAVAAPTMATVAMVIGAMLYRTWQRAIM